MRIRRLVGILTGSHKRIVLEPSEVQMRIVSDTATRLGITAHALFLKAYREMGKQNPQELADTALRKYQFHEHVDDDLIDYMLEIWSPRVSITDPDCQQVLFV